MRGSMVASQGKVASGRARSEAAATCSAVGEGSRRMMMEDSIHTFSAVEASMCSAWVSNSHLPGSSDAARWSVSPKWTDGDEEMRVHA